MFKIVSWFSWININNNESFVKWDSEKSLQVTLAFRAGQRVLKCCPLFIKSPQVHNRYQIRIAHTHSDYSSLYGITAYTMHPSRSFSKQWNWNLAYQLCQSSKILIWGQIQVYGGIHWSISYFFKGKKLAVFGLMSPPFIDWNRDPETVY